MKKIASIFLAGVMALSLVACGGGSAGTAESKTPPDLTGEWKQSNSDSADSYQSASISGEIIEIYWVSDAGKTKALYWAGSFAAPVDTVEPYTWESKNDKSQTETALLASGDDTKAFTYQNGKISYEVSAMGITKTVELEKQ